MGSRYGESRDPSLTQPKKTLLLTGIGLLIVSLGSLAYESAGAEKLSISGYVGTSSTSAASRVNVVLYLKDKDQAVDSVQTNFLGRYKFSDLEPGTYVIKVGRIAREVVLVKKSMRIDIDLSAADGEMNYAKGAAAAVSMYSAAIRFRYSVDGKEHLTPGGAAEAIPKRCPKIPRPAV